MAIATILFAALAVAAAPPVAVIADPAPAAQPGSDQLELSRLNDRWFEAYRSKDPDSLAGILADDFVGDYGTGTPRTKQQMLAGLRDPSRPASDIRSVDVAVHLFGDTAMVTGRSISRHVRDGRPGETVNRYADIYVRRNGKWQAVGAHVVRVPSRAR